VSVGICPSLDGLPKVPASQPPVTPGLHSWSCLIRFITRVRALAADPAAAGSVVLATSSLVGLAAYTYHRRSTWLDLRVDGLMQHLPRWTHPLLDHVVEVASPTSTLVACLLAAAVAVATGRRGQAALLLGAPFLGLVATGALQELLQRPSARGIGSASAFPSGHMTGVAALSVVVLVITPDTGRLPRGARTGLRLAVTTVALAVAVALVARRHHFVTDVLGSVSVAVVVVLVVSAALEALRRRPYQTRPNNPQATVSDDHHLPRPPPMPLRGPMPLRLRTTPAQRIVLCLVAFAAVAGGGASLALRDPVYEATAQVAVSPMTADQAPPGIPVLRDLGDPIRTIETAAQLLHNRQAALLTAQRLGTSLSGDQVFDAVSVAPLGQTNVLDIVARSATARDALALANTYAHAALDLRSQAVTVASGAALAVAAQQLTQNPTGSSAEAAKARVSNLQWLRANGDPSAAEAQDALLPGKPSGLPPTLLLGLSAAAGALAAAAVAVLATTNQPAEVRTGEEDVPSQVVAGLSRSHVQTGRRAGEGGRA
jgi:capsular polysaccharide biosynthesis protein/membrane-associated phospholipid phosphatase